MDNSRFVTVSLLNQYVAKMFDANPYLETVYLKGEISNFKRSGRHCYFSLKDENSEISAMMFYPDNLSLTFEPVDGMAVQVMGKIQVYAKKGTYAIVIKKMAQEGIGLLYQEYLALKEKLSKEGLFDDKHKKAIPEYPNVVAIITSPTGDAIHDIISTFNRRLPLAKLILYPAQVQGKDAPADLIRALNKVYQDQKADCLIIGRGGGSFEDLSCFNDELLARTLFASPIPTVTGIGHEADYTICDFVASYRAPTPTGAAIALTKEKSDCYFDLTKRASQLKNAIVGRLTLDYQRYQKSVKSYGLAHFDELLDQRIKNQQILVSKLNEHSPIRLLELKTQRVNELAGHLQNNVNHLISNNNQKLVFSKERLKPSILESMFNNYYDNLCHLENNLNNTYQYYCKQIENNITTLFNKMVLLNPFNTMERGYAIILQDGQIHSSINQLKLDKLVTIEMIDGQIDAMLCSETRKIRGNENGK